MIRFIVRQVDFGSAANVGGPVHQKYVTFDGNVVALENYLSFADKNGRQVEYTVRELIGAEVID